MAAWRAQRDQLLINPLQNPGNVTRVLPEPSHVPLQYAWSPCFASLLPLFIISAFLMYNSRSGFSVSILVHLSNSPSCGLLSFLL